MIGLLSVMAAGEVQCGGSVCQTNLPTIGATPDMLKTIIQLVFAVIGSVAVVYMMYAAFRFTRSQGDPKEIAQARQTIIFAVAGLVIALSAEIIVAALLRSV
jgi:hypothetical protein